MQTGRLLWEMGKPRIMGLLCLMTLWGALLSPAPSLLRSCAAVAVVGLLWWGTAIINDLADLAIDRTSNPERPLPSGRIGPITALAAGVCVQIAALLLGMALGNRSAVLLILCGIVLGNLYSIPPLRLRRQGLIANLIIGVGVSSAVMGGQLAQGELSRRGLEASLVLGLAAAAVSLVKDFKDIAGDSAQGVKTLPVRLGWSPAVRVSQWAMALAYGLLLLSTARLVGLIHPLVFAVGILAVDSLLLLHRLAYSTDQGRARKVHQEVMLLLMGVSLCYALAQLSARCG